MNKPFKIETVKLGNIVGRHDAPNTTVKTEEFETRQEALISLKRSLKNGFEKTYNNYFNVADNTELLRNFN